MPILNEATSETDFDRHYIYHTAWAARVLARIKPKVHIDISSSLFFATIASAFQTIDFYDYRPPKLELSNLTTKNCDLLALPFANASVQSLSCMHVVEHVGLGRYGDTLDYDGDLKAIAELERVLRKNGDLLFVVPLGQPRIMFNAHRIYSYEQVISYFPGFRLKEFALIPDSASAGGLISGASMQLANAQTYGCGCFWLQKK